MPIPYTQIYTGKREIERIGHGGGIEGIEGV